MRARAGRVAIACVALAGCSKILGIDDLKGPNGTSDGGTDGVAMDTAPGADAPGDGMGGAMVKVTGKVVFIDNMLNMQQAGNAPIEVIRLPDEVSIASGSTDAAGAYTLSVPINTSGYVRVHGTMFVNTEDTLSYPAHPFATATQVDLQLYSVDAVTLLANLGNAQQPVGAPFGIAVVETATTGPVPGATVSIQPSAQVRYTNSTGQPNPTLTSTGPNGVAMMFGMAIAPTVLTAAQNGNIITMRQIKVGTAATYMFELKP